MKLQEKALAKKYAQAYLHVFTAQVTPAVLGAYEEFLRAYAEHPATFLYLQISLFSAQAKAEMLLKIFEDNALKAVIKPLIALLAAHNRLCLISQVVGEIIIEYKEEHNIMDVTCTSAHPLDVQEQQTIQNFLETMTGKHIRQHAMVDPALIAGVRLQSETFLWEHSIAQQLRALRKRI